MRVRNASYYPYAPIVCASQSEITPIYLQPLSARKITMAMAVSVNVHLPPFCSGLNNVTGKPSEVTDVFGSTAYLCL